MRLNRVYIEAQLQAQSRQWIGGTAASHLSRVLRLRVGDPLTVFDGRGGEYAARIAELHKAQVLIEVGEHHAIERESSLAITLAQGISRGERMDWVVQKATELGVRRIVPVLTERTVVRLDEVQSANRLRHWRAIIIAACEQCGRNVLPEITAPHKLDEFLSTLPRESVRLLLSPEGGLRAGDLAVREEIAVLIGPEGGLSSEEQGRALAAGFEALRLGPRVLRTETAAVVALSVLQQQHGDL